MWGVHWPRNHPSPNYYASPPDAESLKRKVDVEVEENDDEVEVSGSVAGMNLRPRKTLGLDGDVVLLENSSESDVVRGSLAKKSSFSDSELFPKSTPADKPKKPYLDVTDLPHIKPRWEKHSAKISVELKEKEKKKKKEKDDTKENNPGKSQKDMDEKKKKGRFREELIYLCEPIDN